MGSSLVRLTIPDQEPLNNFLDEDDCSKSESVSVASDAAKSVEQDDTSRSIYAQPASFVKGEGSKAVSYNFPASI